MQLPRALQIATVAAVIFAAPAAAGHVAPSEDANNRYIKVSPMADRVRLVYTVFLGEIPGVTIRRTMDTDGDGLIHQREADAYGEQMAARVAGALTLTVDGESLPVAWTQIHVGMGSPQVHAGAFSVDLVTQICAGEGLVHRLSLVDHFAIDDPGETELRVAESPGVRITRSALGPDSTASLFEMKWTGAGGPLATDGLYLDWTVSESADPAGEGCSTTAAESDPDHDGVPRILLIAGGIALVAAALIALRRRRHPGARSAL